MRFQAGASTAGLARAEENPGRRPVDGTDDGYLFSVFLYPVWHNAWKIHGIIFCSQKGTCSFFGTSTQYRSIFYPSAKKSEQRAEFGTPIAGNPGG